MPEASQSAPRRRARVDAEERRRVLTVAKAVSATLGRDFFRSLTEHLAKAVECDCIFVAELMDGASNRIRTVAIWLDQKPAEEITLDLPGTASYQVLIDGMVAWSTNAMRIFPLDPLLADLGAESYVGIRLCDSAGQVLGLIAVAGKQPLRSVPLVKSVLEAFTPRAAAELERKRADDALRESEERYRAFISGNSDAMWRIEFERPVPLDLPEDEQIEWIYRYGYLAEGNDALARLAGVPSADELRGTPFGALFSRDDDRIREELRIAARSGYSAATFATTPLGNDGKKLYRLRTQFGIVENDALRRMWGTTRDITELKRAELAVEASERRFREVLEHIQLPALMLDTNGWITFCNDALAHLANLSKDALTRANWIELLTSSEEREVWTAVVNEPPDSGESQHHFEAMVHLRDAPPRLLVWDTILLRNEDGEAASLAAIGRDITDQKALEARLLQAEKLESIGRLAGGVAHDFNNLLTLILGHLMLVVDRTDPSAPTYNALRAVESATQQCAVLSRELLAIGRRQRLMPELFSLNTVIGEEEAIIRGIIGESIELIEKLEPSLGLVYADPAQFRRILANLVTNSRDAMPEGGRLTITTANARIEESPALVAGISPGEYVCMTVSDTGIGLTEDVKQHMFDPFFTTKAPGKGTGLGLSTVYGIVAQSGGQISAKNEPGGGTTVEILLPRRDRQLATQ